MKTTTLLAVLLLGTVFTAFGEELDPLDFCSIPATNATCTGGDPNPIGPTSFAMLQNGSGSTSTDPWYLLLMIPEITGNPAAIAPTITSASFTQNGSTIDEGKFLPTTLGDVYAFVNPTLVGDNSMNASNLFGSKEQAAFGSTPDFFEVFEYSFNPGYVGNTPYQFTVGGAGLTSGTIIAGSGGSNPFSTPFTNAAMVVPDGGGGGSVDPTPEPGTAFLVLGGLALVGLGKMRRLSAR
jgi:hypothetical protein